MFITNLTGMISLFVSGMVTHKLLTHTGDNIDTSILVIAGIVFLFNFMYLKTYRLGSSNDN